MKLYIRMRNGAPYEHPIIEWNMRQAFPNVDLTNLPPEFMPFERIACPEPDDGKRIVSASVRYEVMDGVVRDVWTVVQEDLPVITAPPEEPEP
jgi:hypothetical protein